MKCVLSPEVDAVLVSVGPCVPLLSGGTRFQLSRSALGLSTLRAPSNAGCVSLGARFRRPLIYAGPGFLRPLLRRPLRLSRIPASRERLLCGICSERCGAGGRAPQDSTEERVSDACGLLRPCRRSGTPQGIPAAEAVLRALTFSALGAPSGNRKGGKNRQIFGSRAYPKYIVFRSQYAILH